MKKSRKSFYLECSTKTSACEMFKVQIHSISIFFTNLFIQSISVHMRTVLLRNIKQQKDHTWSPQRSTHTWSVHLVSVYKNVKAAKHLNTVWGSPLQVALPEQGLDQKTSRGSFQPQPFCDSVISGIAFNKFNPVFKKSLQIVTCKDNSVYLSAVQHISQPVFT